MWKSIIFFLAMLCDMWDLSMTRDQTCIPCIWRTVLTIGLPGKSHICHFCPLAFNHLSFVNDTLFSLYKIPFSTTWVGSGVELVTWPVLYLSHWYIVQFLGKELLLISFLIHTKNATLMSVIKKKKKKLKGGNI